MIELSFGACITIAIASGFIVGFFVGIAFAVGRQ